MNVTDSCDSNYCGERYRLNPADQYILLHAKEIDRSFCFLDFADRYKHGYLRNRFMRLKKMGKILPLPKTKSQYYILPEWKHRYPSMRIVTNDPIVGVKVSHPQKPLEPKRVWTNFAVFLESLPAVNLAHVHDVRLYFSTNNFGFIDQSWKWNPQSKSWNKSYKTKDLWKYEIAAYSTTKTVTVVLACKFYYSICGLLRLVSFLGEIKNQLGDVPEPRSWIVSCWHYGKDFPCTIRGADFEVCFETWSGSLARIYYKNNLAAVRFEEIQTPTKSLQEVFENRLRTETN